MHAQQLGITPDKAKAKEANEKFQQGCAQKIK
jgi:hypothetical protein